MLAILGVAIVPMSAQTQSTTVQVSKLVGTRVKSSQGEEIGVVKDVVIDRNTGCMAYTVLSTGEDGGTRVAGGGKFVAVPWAVYSPTSDVSALTVTVDRDRIYSAPVFDYARIDEYSKPDYITNVYSYYGVSQGAGVGAGVSGTTTTTGVSGEATGRAGAAGSPAQGASPSASTQPATTRSPAERESPAGRASPTPRATPARPHATASSREREGAAASPPAREEERGTRGRPEETESPSSGTREERGTRARPGETESPTGGAELQREPSSGTTRESPPEAASPGERTTEGTQTRRHRKPERREASTPPPGDRNKGILPRTYWFTAVWAKELLDNHPGRTLHADQI
jgi:sporulation protein YlmC with PRC-barrel domain